VLVKEREVAPTSACVGIQNAIQCYVMQWLFNVARRSGLSSRSARAGARVKDRNAAPGF